MNIQLDVTQITSAIVAIAALLTSITALWKRIEKVKSSFDDKLEKAVRQVVLESNKRQDERTAVMLDNLKTLFKLETKNIERQLNELKRQIDKDKKEELNVIQLLKDGLIEAYKNDIRSVYYRLRSTGQINDSDKAYIDKIFPKYVAMGGNSDIQAKYEEICRVYERRTHEKYDETFEKTKDKKGNEATAK